MIFSSYAFDADLSRFRCELRYEQWSVSRLMQNARAGQMGINLSSDRSDETACALAAHGLQPVGGLLDPFALALAGLVAVLTGIVAIETDCSAAVDPDDVGDNAMLAKMRDEAAHAVGFVRTQSGWVPVIATLSGEDGLDS